MLGQSARNRNTGLNIVSNLDKLSGQQFIFHIGGEHSEGFKRRNLSFKKSGNLPRENDDIFDRYAFKKRNIKNRFLLSLFYNRKDDQSSSLKRRNCRVFIGRVNSAVFAFTFIIYCFVFK